MEPGGANPEERMGSEEPVRSDAAVAAAATLFKVIEVNLMNNGHRDNNLPK